MSGVILLIPHSAFAQAQHIEMGEGRSCNVSGEYAVLVEERSDTGENMFVSSRNESRDTHTACKFDPENVDFAIAKRYFYFLG